MESKIIEGKYILEYIKDTLNTYRIGKTNIENARYHHNTAYHDAYSICKHGILTIKDLKEKKIKTYTDEFFNTMDDIFSHVNGINAVSLAVVGLQDLYRDEDEYCPKDPTQVDFLVSSNIKAGRSSTNYGNEFLSYKSIEINSLKSVDIRLLELIQKKQNKDYNDIKDMIKKYNCLKDIALAMKSSKLSIPLREVSNNENSVIDIDQVANMPKLILK